MEGVGWVGHQRAGAASHQGTATYQKYILSTALWYLIRTCHEGHYRAGGLIGVSWRAPLGSQASQGSTIVLISHCKLPEKKLHDSSGHTSTSPQIKRNCLNA